MKKVKSTIFLRTSHVQEILMTVMVHAEMLDMPRGHEIQIRTSLGGSYCRPAFLLQKYIESKNIIIQIM
jgi:hypothetical protein